MWERWVGTTFVDYKIHIRPNRRLEYMYTNAVRIDGCIVIWQMEWDGRVYDATANRRWWYVDIDEGKVFASLWTLLFIAPFTDFICGGATSVYFLIQHTHKLTRVLWTVELYNSLFCFCQFMKIRYLRDTRSSNTPHAQLQSFFCSFYATNVHDNLRDAHPLSRNIRVEFIIHDETWRVHNIT